MSDTTQVVQRYLEQLKSDAECANVDNVVRQLLERSCIRLRKLCWRRLNLDFPRLTRPPYNLEIDDVVGAAVERLIKALNTTRPTTVRAFFGLANRQIRWELLDFARRVGKVSMETLDSNIAEVNFTSDAELSISARRILDAIERLNEEEQEAFELVRIQGLSHVEAADILNVSTKTVQRRLNRALLELTEVLSDLV